MLSYSPKDIFISIERYSLSIYPKYEDEKKLSSLKKRYTDHEIISNDPLSGFRLEHNYQGWYLLDPRGFTYNIKDSDIAYIIDNCVVDNGEIISKCRYYWSGRRMSIISEFDPRFEKINQSKEQREFSISDLDIGDTFSLHGDNKRYIYYGERYVPSERLKHSRFLSKGSIYDLYETASSYYSTPDFEYGAVLTKLAVSDDGKSIEKFSNKKIYDLEKSKIDVSVYDEKIGYNNTNGFKIVKSTVSAKNSQDFEKVVQKIGASTPKMSSYYYSDVFDQYFLMKVNDDYYVLKSKSSRRSSSCDIRKVSDKIESKIDSLLSRLEKNKNKKLNSTTIINLLSKEFDASSENITAFTYDTSSRKKDVVRIKNDAIFFDFAVKEI